MAPSVNTADIHHAGSYLSSYTADSPHLGLLSLIMLIYHKSLCLYLHYSLCAILEQS